MKIYKRRVAFAIADQHLIPHGGLGQFTKGFAEMCASLNWKLDLVVDKEPSNKSFVDLLGSKNVTFIYPKTSISYKNHVNTFAFSDSYNFEKMINFREAMMLAFSRNIYDTIVCNTFESFPAIHSLGIQDIIPVVFYTHNESMVFRNSRKFKNVFNISFNDFFNKIIECENVFVGTQTERNFEELKTLPVKDPVVLPMPMTEKELLVAGTSEKSGVLFIGRWEPGKNPEAFISAIKETGLPAKVITNSNGVKKFKAAFEEAGIVDYEIRAGVVGKEKTDFIKSAKVHFNPSLREAFCFAFFECLGHMPCVVLDGAEWVKNFPNQFYTQVSKNDVNKALLDAYQKEQDNEAILWTNKYHNDAYDKWSSFIDENSIPNKPERNSTAKITSYVDVCLKDYYNDLNRSALAIDDIRSVLTNRHKFKILYTDENTYLYTTEGFTPKETKNNLESLFE